MSAASALSFGQMLRENADQLARPSIKLLGRKFLDVGAILLELSVAVREPSRSARSGQIIQSSAAYFAIDGLDTVHHREAEKHLVSVVANDFAPGQRHQAAS